MTSIHVEVTAENLEGHQDLEQVGAWAHPVEVAMGRAFDQVVDIDGDGPGNIATIGGLSSWTLVVELPAEANAWLNARWKGDVTAVEPLGSQPFAFDIEVPDWVLSLVGS